MSRRLGALNAVLGGALALALSLYVLVVDFPRGPVVFACVAVALACAWYSLLRRGIRRLLGLFGAVALLALGIVVVAAGGNGPILALIVIAFFACLAGARVAFRPDRSLPRAEPPRHPVLFVNPRSGDGRAGEVGLVGEARGRGLETVEMEPGDDLEQLVRAAVARGADGLAMAGGDGSQALVAAIAAEHDLPYACIPSGTRNHFALDLGVDREDVIGALDAFFDGGERYVDLGEVNGRVFVNNVSLGVYAEAVSQDQYRSAKLRTLLDTLTETLGPEGEGGAELRWRDSDGTEQRSTALILVSNNAYRLGPTLGSGTRPRLDAGVLGVVDFHPPTPSTGEPARWRELTAPTLEIEAEAPIPLGVDGEALSMEPPLRFRIRPKALRVRIARHHPGASPSAEVPKSPLDGLRALLRLAVRGE